MSDSKSLARPHPVFGAAIVAAAATSISLSNVLSPIVYAAGTNTETLLVLRFAGFILVCGLWLKLLGIPLTVQRRDLAICVGAGLAYTAGSGALLAAFAFMPVSLAILIFFTFPLITRLLDSALDRHAPAPLELLCFVAALAGLALCLGVGFDRLNEIGLAFAVLAALGVAVSYVWTGRMLGHIQPTVMTLHMAWSGLLLVTLLTLAGDAWQVPPSSVTNWALMAAAAVSFSFAFLGMFVGVRAIGASRTAMIMNCEPIFTIALAFLILGEDLTPLQLIGAALVIVAIVTSQVATRPKS